MGFFKKPTEAFAEDMQSLIKKNLDWMHVVQVIEGRKNSAFHPVDALPEDIIESIRKKHEEFKKELLKLHVPMKTANYFNKVDNVKTLSEKDKTRIKTFLGKVALAITSNYFHEASLLWAQLKTFEDSCKNSRKEVEEGLIVKLRDSIKEAIIQAKTVRDKAVNFKSI